MIDSDEDFCSIDCEKEYHFSTLIKSQVYEEKIIYPRKKEDIPTDGNIEF